MACCFYSSLEWATKKTELIRASIKQPVFVAKVLESRIQLNSVAAK